jgi:hypothetical protein
MPRNHLTTILRYYQLSYVEDNYQSAEETLYNPNPNKRDVPMWGL